MEFSRFGSSIPGAYWGCCAMEIIQNMKVDPDAKAAIQLIDGDGGSPIMKNGQQAYAGPTWRDIFRYRIVAASFSGREMPDHAFLCTMTESQCSGGFGKKWMEVLADEGFELIRSVDNSVYSGNSIISKPGEAAYSSHTNYLFALFRNIGTGCVQDQFKGPAGWKSTVPQAMDFLDATQRAALQLAQQERHLEIYKKNHKVFRTYTLDELYKLGLTDDNIQMAGTQMHNGQNGAKLVNARAQEPRSSRFAAIPSLKPSDKKVKADPFAQVA